MVNIPAYFGRKGYSLFFVLSKALAPNYVCMPSVRFELTTARSSASLLIMNQVECSPRLSYDGMCLT